MFIVLIVLYTDTATATQNAHSRVSCDNELKLSDVNQFDSMVIVMWKKVDMVFLFGLTPFCMHSVHEHLCSVLPSLLEWKSMNRINWCNLTFCFYFGFVSCFFLCVSDLLLLLLLLLLSVHVFVCERSFVFLVLLFFDKFRRRKRRRAHSVKRECMQWIHAINANMIWSSHTRSYQTECVYNEMNYPKCTIVGNTQNWRVAKREVGTGLC